MRSGHETTLIDYDHDLMLCCVYFPSFGSKQIWHLVLSEFSKRRWYLVTDAFCFGAQYST